VPSFSDAVAGSLISPDNPVTTGTSLPIDSLATKGKKTVEDEGAETMTTATDPTAGTTEASRAAWMIQHLAGSIRRRERLLTFTGYATPHTPEDPVAVAERTAQQLATIQDLQIQLAYWEGINAHNTTTTNA
jgi:hypothetical protein